MSFFLQNHTETNSDDWTITKKTTRTIKHENFSKMKILKVDRWALSLIWIIIFKRVSDSINEVLNELEVNTCITIAHTPCHPRLPPLVHFQWKIWNLQHYPWLDFCVIVSVQPLSKVEREIRKFDTKREMQSRATVQLISMIPGLLLPREIS